MSTLADDFLKRGTICEVRGTPEGSPFWEGMTEELRKAADFVHQRLAPPPAKHALEMRCLAERFSFDGDPRRTVEHMIAVSGGELDPITVHQSTRPPAQTCWLEFPAEFDNGLVGRVGAMAELDVARERMVMTMVCRPTDKIGPIVIGTVSVPSLPLAADAREMDMRVHSWHNVDLNSRIVVDEIQTYANDTIDAMFLLCVPRVVETVLVQHPRKLQERRVRQGDRPFLEFRRVTILVGQPVRHYKSQSAPSAGAGVTGISRRKAHRVMEHVRVYREGRETPHVAHVPEHWRGDPKLGIILHDYSVRTGRRS